MAAEDRSDSTYRPTDFARPGLRVPFERETVSRCGPRPARRIRTPSGLAVAPESDPEATSVRSGTIRDAT